MFHLHETAVKLNNYGKNIKEHQRAFDLNSLPKTFNHIWLADLQKKNFSSSTSLNSRENISLFVLLKIFAFCMTHVTNYTCYFHKQTQQMNYVECFFILLISKKRNEKKFTFFSCCCCSVSHVILHQNKSSSLMLMKIIPSGNCFAEFPPNLMLIKERKTTFFFLLHLFPIYVRHSHANAWKSTRKSRVEEKKNLKWKKFFFPFFFFAYLQANPFFLRVFTKTFLFLPSIVFAYLQCQWTKKSVCVGG